MTRTTRRLPLAAASLLALSALVLAFAAPAAADSPGSPNCDPAAAFLGPSGLEALLVGSAPPPQPVAKRGGSIDDPGALATCIADCWDGSSVTCDGTSCNKTDSSCPSQRGQCWGSTTGPRYCPQCPSCTADCWDGSTVTCWGSSCSAWDSDCDNGTVGSCDGSDSGKRWCPVCPCDDSTSCGAKSGTACSGFGTSDCTLSSGGCGNCMCDGSEWLCTF